MKNTNTREVPFFICANARHLFTVRAGIPREEALDHAIEFLDTAHGLMLVAEEIGSEAATAAAIRLIEMAQATVEAAKGVRHE